MTENNKNPKENMDKALALRVWQEGLRKLYAFKDAKFLLFWMIRVGKGVPLTVEQMAKKRKKQISQIKKNLKEIMENAPELINLSMRKGGVIAYDVPKEFHVIILERR